MPSVVLPSGRVGLLQLSHIGRGPAEDIVMIHGLGANLGFWYVSAVQWFRRFGRVTLFDLPGHGESAMPPTGYAPAQLAKVTEELLDHLRIDRAHLVAHSFGGLVALSLALRQPHRVKSLALADVRIWEVEPPSCPPATAARVRRARDAGLTLSDPRYDLSVQVLLELARLRLERGAQDEALSEVLPGARSLFPGKRAAKKWLQLIATTSAYEEMTDPAGLAVRDLGRIEQPIFAGYGGLSPRTRSARALLESSQNCQLLMVPDVGHFFPLTRPRLFARPALAFLRSTIRNPRKGAKRRMARLPLGAPFDSAGPEGFEPAVVLDAAEKGGKTDAAPTSEVDTRLPPPASGSPLLA